MARDNRFSFKVTGRGPFPIDMLRYDACWPASTEDASKITESFNPERIRGPVVVELMGVRQPTFARWESFLWREARGEAMTACKKPAAKPRSCERKHISATVDQIISAFAQDYDEARAEDPDLDDRIERDMAKIRRQTAKALDPPQRAPRRRKP